MERSKGRWETLYLQGVDWSSMGPEWSSGIVQVFRPGKERKKERGESWEPEPLIDPVSGLSKDMIRRGYK